MTHHLEICILAAGMGTRMKSSKPKVLHLLAGRPLLSHLLDAACATKPNRIHVVIGQGAEQIRTAFANAQIKDGMEINWVYQTAQKGTGHAVIQAMPYFADSSRVLVLLGDVPLIQPTTLVSMLAMNCELGVLTVDQSDPTNYGRIIRDGEQLIQIVEEQDTTPEQKNIQEVNTGVMIASVEPMKRWLAQLGTGNAQQEYLLTDLVAIANRQGATVRGYKATDLGEVQGINSFQQLAALEKYYQQHCAAALMQAGVHLVDPDSFYSRGSLTIGQNVSIDVNCIFAGEVVIADHVSIGANCIIKDSHIGAGSEIKPHTMLDGATIADQCRVGPYARIRPGTEMASEVAVGNFVEVKKTKIGQGTKANHLIYLGDSTIGTGVNIGAGTITCNYDGVHKWETHIEDNVFVGSNSALVAPVTIGADATIAAGSTITHLVEKKSLAVARGRQKNVPGWKGPKDR